MLSGDYIVETGATLTIPEGVTIVAEADDDKVDYILIQQGAKIVAEGTAENPIVMTATKKEAGAWGGIHICGKAHSNVEGGTVVQVNLKSVTQLMVATMMQTTQVY